MSDDAAHLAQRSSACPRIATEFKNASDPAHLKVLPRCLPNFTKPNLE